MMCQELIMLLTRIDTVEVMNIPVNVDENKSNSLDSFVNLYDVNGIGITKISDSLESITLSDDENVNSSIEYLSNDVALTVGEGGNSRSDKEDWFVDSAASSHFSFDESSLIDYTPFKEPSKVFLGDDTFVLALGRGKRRIGIMSDGEEKYLALDRVLFVPELAKNLLSVKAMTQKGVKVIFDDKACTVVPKNGPPLTIANLLKGGNLYKLNTCQQHCANVTSADNQSATAAASVNVSSTQKLWHERFGHLNDNYVKQAASKSLVTGMDSYPKEQSIESKHCEACTLGKMKKVSCPKQSEYRAEKHLELVHSDLCGPMQVDSCGGSRYMLTFTDDYSRYTHVYFLKNKGEVFSRFKEYTTLMENITGNQLRKVSIRDCVKTFRTDNSGEYTSREFQRYCSEKGIFREYTVPHTPEQNGVSERLNRTIIEAVRSMIFHADVPLFLWAEAVSTAVYVHNRSPTSALDNKTPYECWYGEKPDVSNLRVFGCVAYYHVPAGQRKKLDPKAKKVSICWLP